MPRKKQPGPGRGSNQSALKMNSPELRSQWNALLNSAIRQAVTHEMQLPAGALPTMKELKSRFGRKAITEFQTWFIANKVFDSAKAEKYLRREAMGQYAKCRPGKVNELINKFAFSWQWSVPLGRQIDAWNVLRGVYAI